MCIVWIPSIICAILSLVTIWHNRGCYMRVDWVLLMVFSLALPNSWIAFFEKGGKGCSLLFLIIAGALMFFGYIYSFIGMIVSVSKTPDCNPTWVKVLDWMMLGVGFLVIILPSLCSIPDFLNRYEDFRRKEKLEEEVDNAMIELLSPPDPNHLTVTNYQQLLSSRSDLRYRVNSWSLSDRELRLIKTHHCLTREELGSELLAESQLHCSACTKPVEVGQAYLQIPSCNHIYDVDCIPRSNRCLICDNNIRLALASHIHNQKFVLA